MTELKCADRIRWRADDGFLMNIKAGIDDAGQASSHLIALDDLVVAGIVPR